MELVGLWAALIGSVIVLVATLPPFAAKYPALSSWLNSVGGLFGVLGGAAAIVAYKPAKAGLMIGVQPGRNPKRNALYLALLGSVVAVVAGVSAIARDVGGEHTLGIALTIVAVAAVVRVAQSLRQGPTIGLKIGPTTAISSSS